MDQIDTAAETTDDIIANAEAGDVDTRQSMNASSLLDKPLTSALSFNWETAAWAVLLITAAVARFYMLGVRAMSHDESLHALYSYYLYDAGNYEHNPMMHGPLLFHVNALVYMLFGDSDTTARLAPALAGLALVAMLIPFRRYIGRVGALAAGVLVAFGPSLLFHSRYIRNDIYIALFSLIWIYAAFRYLEVRNERRMRWLAVMTIAMALGFITKENNFILGALIGAFFTGFALWRLIGSRVFLAAAPGLFAAAGAFWLYETDNTTYAIITAAIGGVITVGLVVYWLWGEKWTQVRLSRPADLAVVMLTLVLPFTAPFGHALFGWDPMASSTNTDLIRSGLLVAFMVVASVALAYYWFGMRRQEEFPSGVTMRQWAQLMGAFWIVQVLFFTTFLTNTRNGLASGVVGSLGYWLAQQEVARGGQPWYYYIMLGGLYEFLPMILSGGAVVTVLYGLYRNSRWDPVAPQDMPPQIAATPELAHDDESRSSRLENHQTYAVFSLYLIAGSWAGYMAAGEKMPWLMTHMALPMAMAGGWWFGWLVWRVDWARVRDSRAVWLVAAAPAMVLLFIALGSSNPSFGRETEAATGILQWLLALAAILALAYSVVRTFARAHWKDGAVLLGLGGVGLLFLLTIRFTFLLNYVNYDMATEYLVYAHGSPDIKRALAEIDQISERTVGDRNVVVAYDDESSWPMSWYMRLYPNSRFYADNPTSDVMTAPVILVGPKNFEAVRPYVARDYVKRSYRRIWWPDQGYFNKTPMQMFTAFTDREQLKRIFDIAFYRRYTDDTDPNKPRDLTLWPTRSEMEMYVRRDIAEDIWDLSILPVESASGSVQALVRDKEIELSASVIFDGTYDGLTLLTPRAVAVAPNGRIIIADSGNHRIVVLDGDGQFVQSFGSLCRLGEGEAGGCVDSDGGGVRMLGDGQFNEPWGVTVDAAGSIYVADTWNGRIQVFDADGEYLRSWGYFNTTSGELGDPFAMFGPRGIDMDIDGNLLVADTGNKRILRFTPQGEFIDQVGGGGVILGRFEEPTDVSIDPRDGAIFVADNWNRRIQKLDTALQPVAEWPVPGWESREIFHKPSIAVAASGDVYITDPEYYRVIAYNADGELKTAFGDYGTEPNRFALPNGIDAVVDSGAIVVADADNNRVMAFPALP